SRYAAAEPGHDSARFEALAGRIAAAVAEAAAARRPARLRRHTVAVPALARNRSGVPWLADPEARELLIANAGLPGCPEQPSAAGVDPCHAVVPLLDALHVVEAHGERTIAVMGSFAMHPTGMPNATELYQADVFGLASARAQAWLHRERRDEPGARTSGAAPPATTPPVVALFNGAQGDVSTNWDPQGRVSTVELGQALGEAVVAALDEPGREIHGEIEVAFAWRPVAGQRFVDSAGEPQRTARRARSGKGQLGGAEDGRTRLYDLGWREGKRRARPRRNGQGHKRPALPWPLSGLAPPPGSTPKAVPLSVVRLGDLPLVTVPAEATTVLGMRIGEQVADALPGHPEVLRVGLAGGYLSYLTTPQEYALQHYEGASMLYGEQAGTLVAMHLARLARSGVVERPSTYRYRVGPRHRWSMDRERRRSLAGLEDRLAWQLETGPLPGLPRFHVWDDAPRWPSDDPRSATTPRARVEGYTEAEGWQTLAPGGLPIDDLTGALAMLLTHVDGQRWRWATWWLDPGAPLHQPLRFHIESIGEGPICSESFTLGQWYRPTGPGWLEPAPCSSRPQ
ncbi:MAG: neutral/alkaline non-lysosomal ceramidase N-terminal domain-containing protein, partial [Nannocystaceae bacterium]